MAVCQSCPDKSGRIGRRIKKVDSKASETTYYYYNDQWQVLAEDDSSDNII